MTATKKRVPGKPGRPRKPGAAVTIAGARQPRLKLTRQMPDGKTTAKHPLIWAMDNRLPEGKTKSDIAKDLGVAPQSIYKWEAACRHDRNFPVPILRAKQFADLFGLHPALFRPDAYKVAA
jgi:DNA-binding XRE family transcriptional regulator